ncbi:MAG: Uncharacterised protein [Crocinitomicaceae bacterium]|nr:MAG: Uncharacterised protein [Crocinitomicaceae bacterium]
MLKIALQLAKVNLEEMLFKVLKAIKDLIDYMGMKMKVL